MRREIINRLTTGLASSSEYRAAIKEASVLELKSACTKMYGRTGTKTRLAACERELRVRGALKNEKEEK
ncbi:MAG: hypothetical protein IJ368_10025 [Oscillospiraceae bacterium]|nr:hypothetical protein [Oscillospiraceae bacterium]